jgi:hypothetical protein
MEKTLLVPDPRGKILGPIPRQVNVNGIATNR